MKLSYVAPTVESLIEGKHFRFTSLAQSAILDLCDGPTVEIVNNQIELCGGGGPSEGEVAEITCSEDGLVHEITILDVEPSGSCVLITVDIDPPFPSTCTATSQVDELGCDNCNPTDENNNEGNCGDNIDNDCDGDVDGDDSGCIGS